MNPVILFRKDYTTEEEFEIAKKYFDVVEFRSDVPADSLVIGRYSTLPYYKELDHDLKINGSKLINSIDQYNWVANFDWYDAVKDYTFETWFRAQDLPDDGTKFVVKGRTNSRKHEWDRLMFADSKKKAIEIMLVLNEDSLIAPQGVVFRRYEPLVTYEIGLNGLPFTNEWRFFFYKETILTYGYYWTMAKDVDHQITKEALKFVKDIAKIVKDYSNFFVLDIGEKISGGWVLIEINDAQMGGLSENSPDTLYSNLKNGIAFDDKLVHVELYGEDFYHKVYDILEQLGGATGDGYRESFIYNFTQDKYKSDEWRFQGKLGFGGKYRGERNVVDCYPEDETPARLKLIKKMNVALKELLSK